VGCVKRYYNKKNKNYNILIQLFKKFDNTKNDRLGNRDEAHKTYYYYDDYDDYYYYYYYTIWMSLVTGLFFLVLLLNQR